MATKTTAEQALYRLLLAVKLKISIFRCFPKENHPPKKAAYCWTLSKRKKWMSNPSPKTLG